MARFVPKDKQSKKAQKELNRQRRTMWDFSPVTKTVDSKKRYDRKRIARNRDDYGLGDFILIFVIGPFMEKLLNLTECVHRQRSLIGEQF